MMNAMILCAGEGTRLRPHTLIRPKPALPFLTVPIAAYGLEWLRELSPRRLVVNTYHLPSAIHELFHRLREPNQELVFSDEQPLLMGPGGGIAKARPLLENDDFFVINGDEILLPSKEGQLRKAFEEHRRSGALATLLVMDHPGVGTQFGGVWTNPANSILGFGKQAWPSAVKGWHFIGAMFLSPRVFKYLPGDRPSNILYDGLTAAIAEGETARIAVIDGWWRETGNEGDYLRATKDALDLLDAAVSPEGNFLRGLLDRRQAGWTLSKARTGAPLLAAAGATSPKTGDVTGFAVLGPGSALDPNAKADSTVLIDGVHVHGASLGLRTS